MTKGRIIALFITIALVLGLAMPALAAGPPDNPGKGPSGLTKIVFVHYRKGVEAKGGIPGSPVDGNSKADDKEWYRYGGVHWADPSNIPLKVKAYDAGNPGGTFDAAIIAAFETWEIQGVTINFNCEEVTELDYPVPSSFYNNSTNLTNEVGWMSFEDYNLPSRAIAVTAVWVYEGTTIIAEADMAMNTDLPWAQDNTVTDPDNETADIATAYDVQNIATHEAGHFLMLEDLYSRPADDQTMYGRGSLGELKKRSLESGDIAGILEIYPE